MKLSKEEQWLLDLFEAGKRRALSPKQVNSLWENTFPDADTLPLRQAVKGLREKGLVEVSSDGSLLLLQKQ